MINEEDEVEFLRSGIYITVATWQYRSYIFSDKDKLFKLMEILGFVFFGQ